jgi:signal peptidase I
MTHRTGRLHYARILLVGVLLALTLKMFVLDAVYVPSRSMERAVLPGDYLILDKTGYAPGWFAFRTPDRGDVVAFTLPGGMEGTADEEGAMILKRCIATAGDSIAWRDGEITVNGAAAVSGIADPGAFFRNGGGGRVPRKGDTIPLDSAHCSLWRDFIVREGHTLDYAPGGGMALDGAPAGAYAVECDYIFVLGDNHAISLDSRSWGFIPARDVVGKAFLIYWSVGDDGSVNWGRIGTSIR